MTNTGFFMTGIYLLLTTIASNSELNDAEQAALAARPFLDGPFAIINADDYYGPAAFRAIYDYLLSHPEGEEYAMVARVLSKKAGKYSSARSSSEGLNPQKFMDTMVSPGSSVHVSPPSSVNRGGGPFSMRVRSLSAAIARMTAEGLYPDSLWDETE